MTTEKHGDYIEIWWEYEPAFYAIRGWVTLDEAKEAIKGHHQNTPQFLEGLVMVHAYLARLQTAYSRSEDLASEIRDYATPGRGRFKATLFVEPAHELAKAGTLIPKPLPSDAEIWLAG